MVLWVLRIVFILLAGSVGLIWTKLELPLLANGYYWILPLTLGLAILIVLGDIWVREKRIDTISSIYFGIIVGLFLNFMAMLALDPYFNELITNNKQNGEAIRTACSLTLGIVLCYITTSFIIQTKDDFRFIVPYVQFAREFKGIRPYLLDTSVIIDGRIADVVESGILDQKLLVPHFVLNELQTIADSGEKIRRARGRRGLDILNRLRSNKEIDMTIYDRDHPELAGQPVDQKLVLLATILEGKIVTNDYNLNKVARLQNVKVINLNDLANAVKSNFLPGERIATKVVRPGEAVGQGVGYLDDGTMIVIEDGREYVGREVSVAVTSVLQTSAGRMIFAALENGSPKSSPQASNK